ncbi:MAG: helicase-related protein, partial [Halobacteriaceae archaeon]
ANIGVHHGSLSKESRIDIEDKFKAGEIDGLLCTSSMELGIDVGRIDHVIQYQSPREVTRLLQRVGRAGHRNDIESNGTIITSNPDDTFEAMAIARRALHDNVENTNIHYDSLDTVANQVVGLVIDHDTISARLAYEIITSAYPFRNLDESTFKEIVTELDSNRVIWLDEEQDQLEKTGGTWQYYYANLSMIPDEETYVVHNMATDTQVGTLDERFVVNFAEPGETFIQGGKMWRIVEIEEEQSQVNVSPIEDPAGEIPSWVGEEIPVPYAVAQEVGEIRDIVANQLQEGASLSNVANELPKRYPLSSETANRAIRKVVDQIRESTMVPTDDRIVIERDGRTIIINACFGHNVNETLGRVLSALLGQRTGSSIGLETDPYRIELETPGRITTNDVIEILETTDPDHIATIIELSLQQSDTLKFTLSHIAAKFGALKRWKGGNNISSNRLISMLEDTPIHDEAIREIFQTDLAIAETQSILHDIAEGDINIVSEATITPIGSAGRSGGKELLAPENADASVVATIKERIMNDRVRLFCTHCKQWDQQTKVKRIDDQPKCPNCDSTRIAALSPWADDKVQAVKTTEKTEEQESLAERAYRNASLVQGHGKQAVIALQGRGVGPQNAARIINNHRENENDFYRDILEREREYARTKSFWD